MQKQPSINNGLRARAAGIIAQTGGSTAIWGLVNSILAVGTLQGQTTNPPPAVVTSTNVTKRLPEVLIQGTPESYKPDHVSSPKYTEPLRDTPQTIQVIPKAVIEDRGASSLRDVLRNMSGLTLQSGEGGVPNGDNVLIRGFSARTDFFVDGMRDMGTYFRDPFNYEQVEVSKGPASAYSGRGSTGGSINLVTKTPSLTPFYEGTLGIGSADYTRVTGDFNQPLPNLEGAAVRLNGVWHDSGVAGRDVVENEHWGIAPSLVFGLGTPTRLTLTYLHQQEDNNPDYGIPWVPTTNVPLAAYADQTPPVRWSNYYGILARDYERTQTDMGTALAEHDFSDSLKLRDQFRYGQTFRDSIISAPRFNSNATTDVLRQTQSRDEVDAILANQTDLTAKFNTGKMEHTLVGGIEYAHETSANHPRVIGAAPLADLYNPNPNDPYTGTIVTSAARDVFTSDSVGLYLSETFKPTEKLQLSSGLRWDYSDTHYNTAAGPNFERLDKVLTWRAAILYKPAKNGSVYFGYGTSFNPSAEGLTLAANTVLLDPEKAQNFELGTKWDFLEERLGATLALFRAEKTNARTPGLPGDPPMVLAGNQRVDGVEAALAGNITQKWKVFGTYTFMKSEIEKSNTPAEVGKEIPGVPQHTFNLWTTYELPLNLEAGGGVQFQSSSYINPTNTRLAPDFYTLDAMLAYKVNQHFTLRLNVYNLTDQQYIGTLYTVGSRGQFIPGARRSAMLTATVKF